MTNLIIGKKYIFNGRDDEHGTNLKHGQIVKLKGLGLGDICSIQAGKYDWIIRKSDLKDIEIVIELGGELYV